MVLWLAAGVPASFGSVLVLKTVKEIDSAEPVEIAALDASKHQRLRIAIDNTDERAKSRTDYGEFRVYVFAADEAKDIFIASSLADNFYSSILELPPGKIKIKISGKGKFRLFVWAS